MRGVAIFLFLARSVVNHALIVKNVEVPTLLRRASDNSSGSSREAKDFASQCYSIGPAWNPLQECATTFKRTKTDLDVTNKILCKLKKDLQFRVWTAWSFLDHINLSRSVSANSLDKESRQGRQHDYNNQPSNHRNTIGNLFRYNASGHNFRTCAVVSNSGVLRNHNHGAAIDATDLVIRFNDAPLHGWAHLVGSKEDTRITNQQFPERVLNRTIPSYIFQDHTLVGLLTYDKDENRPPGFYRLQMKYPDAVMRILPHSLMESLEQTLRYIYSADWFHGEGVSFIPTTGSVGMLTALAACDRILAFGMAATPGSHNFPYHYYAEHNASVGETSAGENGWHKTFDAEKDLWRRIAKNHPIEIDKTDIAVIPGFSQVECV
jgi:hypothetical protein|mmetsp:Transcript_68910/g.109333  ORF Transcript_68910/g.109333 Transcript_68910/m.109333 type:complete len:378 (-) Transcript_68910:9-1142(-)